MTKVLLKTNHGDIKLQLNSGKAPDTVKNFLEYVNAGFYSGTIFHRVIDGFMVQGGGFDEQMSQKKTYDSIKNEANNGLVNNRGTIAMARTMDPHSATAQFFINLVDNDFLNYSGATPQGWGYAVFGEVIEGLDVMDAIAKVETKNVKGMADVPAQVVTITSAAVVEN